MGYNSTKKNSIIWGLLIVTAGLLLLAFNTGLLPQEYKHVIFSWAMIPVVIGFGMIFSRHSWLGGIILMIIGCFFILPKMNVEKFEFIMQNRWALGLVLVGIVILFRTIFGKRFCRSNPIGVYTHIGWDNKRNSHKHRSSKNEQGYIERNCVFGGGKEHVNIKEFKGGEINCVFGGVELDMTGSELAEGVYTLEINSAFGGCVLYLPIEWNIEIRPTHVFGQFVDNRPKPSFEIDEKRKLIIEANAVFGGGEIKCRED